jgi:hypothetical protein
VNKYFADAGMKERENQFQDAKGALEVFTRGEEGIAEKKEHLEYKMSPEQIVVAIGKAEKDAQAFIQDHQQKRGWKAWIPTVSVFGLFGGEA